MSFKEMRKSIDEIAKSNQEINKRIKINEETKSLIEKKISTSQIALKRYKEEIMNLKNDIGNQREQLDTILQEIGTLEEKKHENIQKMSTLEQDLIKNQIQQELNEDEKFLQELESDLAASESQRKEVQNLMKSVKNPQKIISAEEDKKGDISESRNNFDPGIDEELLLFKNAGLTRKNTDLNEIKQNSLAEKIKPLKLSIPAVEKISDTKAGTSNPFLSQSMINKEIDRRTYSEYEQPPKGKESETVCVICHSLFPPAAEKTENSSPTLENSNLMVSCPNGHTTHRECLKHWIVHSTKCPVCHEDYSDVIISSYQTYIKLLKKEQERAEATKRAQVQAQQLEPEDDPNYTAGYNVVKEYLKKKDYERAIAQLWNLRDQRIYSEKDPHTLKIVFQLGVTYYKLQNYPLAQKQLMSLVRIDFQYPLGFYFLGKVYKAMEMPDKMVWAYERSIKNLKSFTELNPRYQKFYSEVEGILIKANKL